MVVGVRNSFVFATEKCNVMLLGTGHYTCMRDEIMLPRVYRLF